MWHCVQGNIDQGGKVDADQRFANVRKHMDLSAKAHWGRGCSDLA